MSKEKLKAIILMILSSLSFALQQVFVKKSAGAIPMYEQIFVRNLVSIVIAVVMASRSGADIRKELKEGGILLWGRSIIGYLGIIVYFYAIANARQADVSVIYRMGPVFITVLAVLILKEKITQAKITAIVLCMAGAYIAMAPAFESDPLPLLSALASAFVSGITYTLIALCRGKASATTIVLHYSVVCAVLAGIMCAPSFVIPSSADLLCLVAIGICAAAGQLFLSFAYTHAPASEVSIYDYTGIPFSALLGFCVFGEALAGSTIIGALLVFSGVLILFLSGRKSPE